MFAQVLTADGKQEFALRHAVLAHAELAGLDLDALRLLRPLLIPPGGDQDASDPVAAVQFFSRHDHDGVRFHLLEVGELNFAGSNHSSSSSRAFAFFLATLRNAACSWRSSSPESNSS